MALECLVQYIDFSEHPSFSVQRFNTLAAQYDTVIVSSKTTPDGKTWVTVGMERGSPEGLFVLDKDGRLLECTKRFPIDVDVIEKRTTRKRYEELKKLLEVPDNVKHE